MGISRKLAIRSFISQRFNKYKAIETKSHTRFYRQDNSGDYAIYWKHDHSITFKGFWGDLERDYLHLSGRLDGRSKFDSFDLLPF